ncbi:hypothetical protein D3C87_1794520 [compost metagenome]
MRAIVRQHPAARHQVALAQGAHDPVVIDPFPAGFAHRAADRRIAATPQQAALKLVDARERENAPAHLFAHQIDICPYFTLAHRQQRRVVRE